MIRRFQLLRNLGQFDSVDAGNGLPLANVTVIVSENGRGKTTLAEVLRSLSSGNSLPILERARLDAPNPPEVVVEIDGTTPAVFRDGHWNQTAPGILVFDDVFTDANVHSGLAVGAGHRHSLHELVLGSQAVDLTRELQELVERIETHNTTLRARAGNISGADRGQLTVEAFCALPAVPEVDEAIRRTERDLAAAGDGDRLRAAPDFATFVLPTIDIGEVETILRQSLESLDRAALAALTDHLAAIGPNAEPWVGEGVARIPPGGDHHSSTCPFCAQTLERVPLVDVYRAYFSEEYRTLKRTVSTAIEALDREHGGDAQATFERSVRIGVERGQYWARFVEMEPITLDTEAIVTDWRSARDAIREALLAKQSSPTDSLELPPVAAAAVQTFGRHGAIVMALNARLREANLEIQVAKERVAAARADILRQDLIRLVASRTRHMEGNSLACEAFLREREAKEATEQRREQVRAQLERLRTTLFPGYEEVINRHLQAFNAGFRLARVTSVNTRGGPTVTYDVIVRDRPIQVGAGDQIPGMPSFATALSAGDRNTLSLAFFFALLDQDASLDRKVVVIDDPVSSLDDHRTWATVQAIVHLAERASQVIVLSHSKRFLCRLWDSLDRTQRSAIEIARADTGSTLREWHVDEDSITEHDRRHRMLGEFIEHGATDLRPIARAVRPHLEAYLRVSRPGEFPPGTMLGPFMNIARQRLGTPRQVVDAASLTELGELVDYANRFHHDSNPAWDTEPVNDGELRGIVVRTLRYCSL